MPTTVYCATTSREIATIRNLLIHQITDAGMTAIMVSDDEQVDDARLINPIRYRIADADAIILVVTYNRAPTFASLSGRSLPEIEYALAHELGKTIGVFMPEPESDMAMYLRQRAIGQAPHDRIAQQEFMQRLMAENAVHLFDDEADLTGLLAEEFGKWSAVGSEAPVHLSHPPGILNDLKDLVDLIATQTAQRLQNMRPQEMAKQALRYQNALRLKPGELVFGEPLTGRQFQSDIFVVMPFSAEISPVYREVIKPLAADLNLRVVRGDEFTSSRGSIIEEVWAALNGCRMVVADISGGNDNVFYELGIAHTLNKPAILLTQAQSPEDVPFDVRHLRYIQYQMDDLARLRADLEAAINWLLADLEGM